MRRPSPARNEEARLEVLVGLGIRGSEPDDWLDRITAYGRSRFRVPLCLVSLVDADRQWFMSPSGLAVTETRRDVSFCGHAVADDRMLVVTDASRDGRFFDNPLVTREPHVRFYAGSPVRVKGQPIGTLCIIDRAARGINTEDAGELATMADAASWHLAHRRRATAPGGTPSSGWSTSGLSIPAPPTLALAPIDDTSDPWQAAVAYLTTHRDTLEGRMLAQVAFGYPGSGRERGILPWEESLLSPHALGLARRMMAARSRGLAQVDPDGDGNEA